jgi:hypothetical protein
MGHRQHLAREGGVIEGWNPARLGLLVAVQFGNFAEIALPSNLPLRLIIFEGGKFCSIPNDIHSTGHGQAAALRKPVGQPI